MFQLKILFALALIMGLTACSSNSSKMGSEDTDLRPIGGYGAADSQTPQYGEDLDLGVEIMGVEIGETAYDVNEFSAYGDNLVEGEMRPIIYFGYDESELSEKNTEIAKHYSEVLLQNPKQRVLLYGHTDERGTPEYNLALGERRAKSVERVMMMFGVAQSRIESVSFGEEQPLDFGSTEAAWDKNRRVEIKIQ